MKFNSSAYTPQRENISCFAPQRKIVKSSFMLTKTNHVPHGKTKFNSQCTWLPSVQARGIKISNLCLPSRTWPSPFETNKVTLILSKHSACLERKLQTANQKTTNWYAFWKVFPNNKVAGWLMPTDEPREWLVGLWQKQKRRINLYNAIEVKDNWKSAYVASATLQSKAANQLKLLWQKAECKLVCSANKNCEISIYLSEKSTCHMVENVWINKYFRFRCIWWSVFQTRGLHFMNDKSNETPLHWNLNSATWSFPYISFF